MGIPIAIIFVEFCLLLCHLASLIVEGASASPTNQPTVYNVTGIFNLSSPDLGQSTVAYNMANALLCQVAQLNSGNNQDTLQGQPFLPGIQFSATIIDSQSTDFIAVPFALSAIPRGSLMVIGPENDFEILQVAAVLNGEGTAQFGIGLGAYSSLLGIGVRPVQPILQQLPPSTLLAQALYELCVLYNWTVIAEAFSYDILGVTGRELALLKGQQSLNIYSTCSINLQLNDATQVAALDQWVKCVYAKNVQVVVVWGEVHTMSKVIAALYQATVQRGVHLNITFLLVARFGELVKFEDLAQPPPPYTPFSVSFLRGTWKLKTNPNPNDFC